MEFKLFSMLRPKGRRSLDTELVADIIRESGMDAVIDGEDVTFIRRGENWIVSCRQLPVVQIAKTYSLADVDYAAMRRSAERTTDEMAMVKATVDEEAGDITFRVAAVEKSYGHFRESFHTYLRIIDAAVKRQSALYLSILN